MSTIARVFIVLNFVLSIFFVGVASTLLYKADNFKLKYEDEKKKHENAVALKDEEIRGLRGQIQTAESSLNSVKVKNVELDRDNSNLKNDKTNLETARVALQTTVDGFEKSLSDLKKTMDSLRSQNESLQKSTDEATVSKNDALSKQAEAEAEVVRKEDALKDREEQIAQLQKQIVDLSEVKKAFELQMDMLKDRNIDLASLVAPPPISGLVSRVNEPLRLVMLSVGADDGVKTGYTFKVFRGGDFIGDVVVDEVFPDNCSARIHNLARGKAIQANDQATTRL